MKRILTSLFALALIGAVSTIAAAKPTECNSTITGTVNSGLIVLDGDVCNVAGATINGGIKMSGGTLTVCGATINGDIHATGGVCAIISELPCGGSSINGHVSIANMTGKCGIEGESAELESTTVNGGVDLDNNGGNGVELESNTISGSVDCEGNVAVFDSGGNTVAGQKKGQCSGI